MDKEKKYYFAQTAGTALLVLGAMTAIRSGINISTESKDHMIERAAEHVTGYDPDEYLKQQGIIVEFKKELGNTDLSQLIDGENPTIDIPQNVVEAQRHLDENQEIEDAGNGLVDAFQNAKAHANNDAKTNIPLGGLAVGFGLWLTYPRGSKENINKRFTIK